MKTKSEVSVADVKEKRLLAWIDMAFRDVDKGVPAAEIDQRSRDADRTLDQYGRLRERILARRKAVADLAEAARLDAEHKSVMERLEKHVDEIKAANEKLEELRRGQLAILAEASQISNRMNGLRSSATATMQKTAEPGTDWSIEENVRVDDAAPAAKVLSQEKTHCWRAGNTAVLPSSQFIPANRG